MSPAQQGRVRVGSGLFSRETNRNPLEPTYQWIQCLLGALLSISYKHVSHACIGPAFKVQIARWCTCSVVQCIHRDPVFTELVPAYNRGICKLPQKPLQSTMTSYQVFFFLDLTAFLFSFESKQKTEVGGRLPFYVQDDEIARLTCGSSVAVCCVFLAVEITQTLKGRGVKTGCLHSYRSIAEILVGVSRFTSSVWFTLKDRTKDKMINLSLLVEAAFLNIYQEGCEPHS